MKAGAPAVLLLAACALTAAAEEPEPTYFKPAGPKLELKGDSLLRYEHTTEGFLIEKDRWLWRNRPRLELTWGKVVLGLGVDFNRAGDDNQEPPPNVRVRPLNRDNYITDDKRLDLAFARFDPARWLRLEAGRFIMPVGFTEMVWDRDLRPQGGALSFIARDKGRLERFALTALGARGSHVLPQEGAFDFTERETVWSVAAEGVLSTGTRTRLDLTAAWVGFRDLEFVDPQVRRQNTRASGALVREYDVLDFVLRWRREARVPLELVGDLCWNASADDRNRGLWLAAVGGSFPATRARAEYVYALIDPDATLAAFGADDFLWVTGWEGHKLDLGVRAGDHFSFHAIGQTQRFKDAPQVEERDHWFDRLRLEVRFKR